MSTRDEINEAFRAMLETGSGKQIYLLKVTDDPPRLPYAVAYPLNTGEGQGSFEDAEEDRDYVFQVTSVGRDARQCAAMSSKVEAVILSKNPGGEYVHPMALVGHAVQWRLSAGAGSIVPSGESLYESADTYRLRIGRA